MGNARARRAGDGDAFNSMHFILTTDYEAHLSNADLLRLRAPRGQGSRTLHPLQRAGRRLLNVCGMGNGSQEIWPDGCRGVSGSDLFHWNILEVGHVVYFSHIVSRNRLQKELENNTS